MYYNLLKQGKKITVSDKNGIYTASTFEMIDGSIWYKNDEIGKGKSQLMAKTFNNHITRMLQENFTITID